MASELYVETLKGLTSGANANKVIIPSGQTLDASAGTFLPSSGGILQRVNASTTNELTVNNGGYSNWDELDCSITTKGANSTFLIVFNPRRMLHAYVNTNNVDCFVQFTDGTNIKRFRMYFYGSSTSETLTPTMVAEIDTSWAAGTSKTVSVQAYSGGNMTLVLGDSGASSTMSVYEVAA